MFPDFNLPFWLYTNASSVRLGAILAQVQEGWEHIICCASHTTIVTECHYGTTKLECLAMVWALHMFQHYLVGITFEVFIDHYTLQWMKTTKAEATALHGWRQEIEELGFVV